VADRHPHGAKDAVIGTRLDMNVRTCRAHIAKPATALGSGSRARLGYLIAKSELLNQDPEQEFNQEGVTD
jgi:hypothetical protein